MRKSMFICLLSALVCLTFISCTSEKTRINLSENWEYSLEPDGDFTPISSDERQCLAQFVPERKGYIYLRNTFTVPEELKDKDLKCYLGRITMVDFTYLNGNLIGNEGRLPPHEWSGWNISRLYAVPNEILEDTNTLLIKIWVNGEGSVVSSPFIGLTKDAKFVSNVNNFFNSKIHLLFAFFMLIISVYHIMIYAHNPNEKENLIFSFINLVSVIYLSVFYIEEIPGLPSENLSFIWFQKIVSHGLMYFIPFMVTTFINCFLHQKEPKLILVLRFVFLLTPIIIGFFAKDYIQLHTIRTWLQAFLIPPMLHILILLIKAALNKKNEFIPLLIGFSPIVITVIIDLGLHNIMKFYNMPYITPLGWQIAIITLLFIMASRLAHARRQAEDLNEHLENKVNERTRQLSESNRQLENMNHQLESTNLQLEVANTDLEHARITAEKDMTLAVYVQKSFYNKTAPRVAGWDIAYLFQPKSGVSGDLYDFFTEGNKLNGVGLFDVSGHGISSGLVTMLAKTVIDKKFSEGMNEGLGTVVKKINETFINEKGSIENYLTGVLVRIRDDKIELLNAGHPTVFCRSAKSQSVFAAEIKDKEGNVKINSIIGVAGMDTTYKALKFSLGIGDSIILYTDCLSETKNHNGEEFGKDRIGKAFAESGNGSAQNQLDNVLNAFNNFTHNTIVNDDLTVIILKRTRI